MWIAEFGSVMANNRFIGSIEEVDEEVEVDESVPFAGEVEEGVLGAVLVLVVVVADGFGGDVLLVSNALVSAADGVLLFLLSGWSAAAGAGAGAAAEDF